MRFIVLQNEAMIAEVLCGKEALFVGSREDCRLHLPDVRIAPQQAVIYPESGGAWTIEVLDTTCITQINAHNVQEKSHLKTGDEIQILDFTIRVFPEHEESAGPAQPMGTSKAALERFAASRLPPGAIVKRPDEPLTLTPAQVQRAGLANLAVSESIAAEHLMDVALRTFLEAFAAQRAWIGVRRVNYGPMEYVEGRFIAGQSFDLPEHVGDLLKPRALDRGQYTLLPLFSPEERISMLSGPLPGPDGTLGMVYIDSGDSGRRFDIRDMDYFILLCETFGVQLDAIFKQLARNREATIEGQVSVAHEIQARLTPRKLPQWEELQFGAFREPGRQRTGDVYDLVKLANNQAAVMLATTTAGGAFPSMLMSQAQAVFRCAVMYGHPPNLFLRSLNLVLYDGQKDHPQDAFMCMIDPSTGQMQYAIAGTTGAYIIGQRGEERRLGPREPSPALGLVRSTTYPLMSELLEPGETLVLFTPGVTTAKNRRDETFGEDRFVNILCDGFGQLASAMLKEMLSDLRSFTEGGSQPDDITVVLAHRVSD